MKISLTQLQETTKKVILSYGYSESEAQTIMAVMMYAQTRGNNQGIVKLIGGGIPKFTHAGEIEIEKESPVSAHINGHQNNAMVVVNQATDIAIQKAKTIGITIVGVHGIASSSGAIGYYANKIAKAGLVGLVFAGSMETVAAHGSYQPLFGTNPLAIAIPTQGEPLVLDMATAAMAYFGLVEAHTAGKTIPEGIAYDKDGNLTTDPALAMDGALKTFDKGYKGMGLSMIVQILAGPLVGAYFTGVGDVKSNWAGHLIIAFDPALLGGL